MEENIGCSFADNHFLLELFDTDMYCNVCCFYRMDRLKYNYFAKNFDIENFFEEKTKIKNYFNRNRRNLCDNCFLYDKQNNEKNNEEKNIIIGLCISLKCNLRCPYCYHVKLLNNNPFSLLYNKNKEKIEKLISDNRIVGINNSSGELYFNKELQDLYLRWKELYNIEIYTLTNFILFDPNYPIDKIRISWHKNSNISLFKENLLKIPERLYNKEKINVHIMLGNKDFAWTPEEAIDLLEFLPKEKFNVMYINVKDDLRFNYSWNTLKSLTNKTIELGYSYSRVQDNFLHYEKKLETPILKKNNEKIIISTNKDNKPECSQIEEKFFLNFYDAYYSGYPCCYFNTKYFSAVNDFDINTFFETRESIKEKFYKNYKSICSNCFYCINPVNKKKENLKYLNFNIISSTYCNLNCQYCFHGTPRPSKTFTDTFLKNKELIEKIIISNPSVKIITNNGGEFFFNPELMKMFLNWKKEYGIEIHTLTNFTLYNYRYPLDSFMISWHKLAGIKPITDNLKKVPDLFFEKNKKLIIHIMIGDKKYAWTPEEAFELTKNYLSPHRITVNYMNVSGAYAFDYDKKSLQELVDKTMDLGYSHCRVQSNDWHYLKTS